MAERFDELVETLLTTLLTSEATLPPEVRAAVMARAAREGGAERAGGEVPAALAPLVDTIARHADRVTDDHYQSLRGAGYSEDQLFEATLCAATGAAWARLERGLAALRGGRS